MYVCIYIYICFYLRNITARDNWSNSPRYVIKGGHEVVFEDNRNFRGADLTLVL